MKKSIPKTLEEAFSALDKAIILEEDKKYIVENGAISVHDSLGRWIRNNWGFWEEEPNELKKSLNELGFLHPDDMSNYIIEEYIKYLKNE